MEDQLYRRSLGYPVDDERLSHEVTEGISTGNRALDAEYEDDLSIVQTGDERVIRLQDIEYEMACLYGNNYPPQEDIENMLMLELEKASLVFELAADKIQEYLPDIDTLSQQMEACDAHDVLLGYLHANLEQYQRAGLPVDAEMFKEAGTLCDYIIEGNGERSPVHLLRIAGEMSREIVKQKALQQVVSAT